MSRGQVQVVKGHLTTTTMVKITVLDPKNGRYSNTIEVRYEKAFKQLIQGALLDKGFRGPVERGNAGRLLDIIRQEATRFRLYNQLKWPETLPDLDACNEYVNQDDVWELLRDVYNKNAYVWLIGKGTSNSFFVGCSADGLTQLSVKRIGHPRFWIISFPWTILPSRGSCS